MGNLKDTAMRGRFHRNRKRQLEEVLSPILADGRNNLLLLCWGDKNRCRIIPTDIGNEADEVNTWEKIHTAWYACRGSWRKYIPLFGVRRVDVVKITIAGYNSATLGRSISKIQYVGLYQDMDLASKRSELERNIANYRPQEFPCPYNSSTGMVDCATGSCISYMQNHMECPEKRLYESQRQLLHLTRRPLLTQTFSNGDIAKANDLLKEEGLIYSHSDILRKLNEWHVPDLSEIQFNGLLITEGWGFDMQNAVIPLALSFFFLVIVGSKVIYNDWGTVWNVGSFFVSLAALLLMWANHAVRL